VSENPFAGATRDPIALLEQLIGHVAGIRRDMDEMKQDLADVKQDFGARFDHMEAQIGAFRTALGRFTTAMDKEQDAFKGQIEATMDRKNWMARNEWQAKQADLERRVAELEEAERRRREGKGA